MIEDVFKHLDHGGHVVQPEGALVVPAHHQPHTLESGDRVIKPDVEIQILHVCTRNFYWYTTVLTED